MQHIAVRHRVFAWTFAGLAPLLLGLVVVAQASGRAGAPAGGIPAFAALQWGRGLQLWWLWLAPATFLAWLTSHWINRQVEAPLNELADRMREIRYRRSAWTFRDLGANSAMAPIAGALDRFVVHVDGVLRQQYECLTDAAHELRTPLTAQTVVAENALSRAASEHDLRDTVVSILEEAKYMQRLIENVLMLKRASAMHDAPGERRQASLHDLSAIAQGCVSTLMVLAEDKGQTLVLDLRGALWSRVDPTMVRQAVLNVVHNAIEHCPRGTRIDVFTEQVGSGRGVVVVADDGQGIALEDRPRVFSTFFRGSRTTRQRGLGLGLAIAKAALNSQGGNIRLCDTGGRGCRFDLEFPLTARAEDHVRSTRSMARPAGARARRGAGAMSAALAAWPQTIVHGHAASGS